MPSPSPTLTTPFGEFPLITLLGLEHLSVSQRLALAQELWASLAAGQLEPVLSPELAAELDRRVQDHEARPDDVIPWSEVKKEIRARLGGET